jgi:hypothetical protein
LNGGIRAWPKANAQAITELERVIPDLVRAFEAAVLRRAPPNDAAQ